MAELQAGSARYGVVVGRAVGTDLRASGTAGLAVGGYCGSIAGGASDAAPSPAQSVTGALMPGGPLAAGESGRLSGLEEPLVGVSGMKSSSPVAAVSLPDILFVGPSLEPNAAGSSVKVGTSTVFSFPNSNGDKCGEAVQAWSIAGSSRLSSEKG